MWYQNVELADGASLFSVSVWCCSNSLLVSCCFSCLAADIECLSFLFLPTTIAEDVQIKAQCTHFVNRMLQFVLVQFENFGDWWADFSKRKISQNLLKFCFSQFWLNHVYCNAFNLTVAAERSFLADNTNGRTIGTVFCLSVTWYIVAKRCVLEQKLLLRAYRKSYMRNWLVPKWMTLTFV